MAFYILPLKSYFKNGKKKKKKTMLPFWGKRTEEKRNIGTIYVDGKLQGESLD